MLVGNVTANAPLSLPFGLGLNNRRMPIADDDGSVASSHLGYSWILAGQVAVYGSRKSAVIPPRFTPLFTIQRSRGGAFTTALVG